MELLEKAAYIKGMIDGMDLSESKEVKLINALADLVSDLAAEVVALQEEHDELFELVDIIDQDLGDVEEIVFECDGDCQNCDFDCGEDDEDDFDDEEEIYETTCPACGEVFYVTEEMLDEGETTCPACGADMEIDLEIDDLDD